MSSPTQDETLEANQPQGKQKRGFALLSKERLAQVTSLGGKKAHQEGRAHRWTSEEAKEAARKSRAARAAKGGGAS